jgi:hypothetical protein
MSLAMSPAGSQDQPAEVPQIELVTQVRLRGERIEYSGPITAEAVAGVFDVYQSAQPKPTLLLIQSQGGSADAGMRLGAWMRNHDLDVAVDTFCFSTCANYVFTAGRMKTLAPHASLMWHGGVTQQLPLEEIEGVLDQTLADMDAPDREELLRRRSRAELIQQLQDSVDVLIARETAFFRKIGVDQRITILGHLYERELLQGEGYYMGWDYSLQDLAKLGVGNIRVKDDAAWEPLFPIRSGQIYRIELDRLPAWAD